VEKATTLYQRLAGRGRKQLWRTTLTFLDYGVSVRDVPQRLKPEVISFTAGLKTCSTPGAGYSKEKNGLIGGR
jgi:hypothetical protein